MTPLDTAFEAMDQDPDNTAARLRFFERLADSELYLLLEAEPAENRNQVSPRLFPVEDQTYALIFDSAERLSDFAEDAAPYLTLEGRELAEFLRGKAIGLGLNLGVAPSSTLLPASAVDWLAGALDNQASEVSVQVREVTPPVGVPQEFLKALDVKLSALAGLARGAILAGTVFDNNSRGTVLAVLDAPENAQSTLREAISEAVSFSATGLGLDIFFTQSDDPSVAPLRKVGLVFSIPERPQPKPLTAPGLDPAKPPKLR